MILHPTQPEDADAQARRLHLGRIHLFPWPDHQVLGVPFTLKCDVRDRA